MCDSTRSSDSWRESETRRPRQYASLVVSNELCFTSVTVSVPRQATLLLLRFSCTTCEIRLKFIWPAQDASYGRKIVFSIDRRGKMVLCQDTEAVGRFDGIVARKAISRRIATIGIAGGWVTFS